ncbi:class V chitinase, putative [Talaromyces stipitatus ATCC 10500]|uniref:chitinase n=1 Tax=Talaromyces stipitatus (strain ATCC 10500 / CBS 375.48 / QM 6759 / NRRL 1006) TaxID=441959 RepID=B8MJ29_TALSN|nr:class V chitinase, putative [Talaromyces stipitatus ATCC 10500]EED15691.1 class V chitinase, putative [Talaromyces stipitatus ATCC 10500]
MKYLALTGFLAAHAAALRNVMYVDQWHISSLPSSDLVSSVTHAIMAFAPSENFNSGSTFTPFESIDTFRARFPSTTKIMVAIGGWGDNAGFSTAAVSETSRSTYAKNVAAMLESTGLDGVDLDWEYPGGNGADYKTVPNSQRAAEVNTLPLLVRAIRDAIGDDKILSIATPGLKRDMIGYTAENGPTVFGAVDMVNIMSYDLMNRRDNVTKHHTSIKDSLETVNNYLDIGMNATKGNLGIAFYAKYFTTDPSSDCATNPVGCATVELEDANGQDTGKSGAVTFETSPEVSSSSITSSWSKAKANGITDEDAGGQYYWDSDAQLFWTWDTPDLITQKFADIIAATGLGGVMAWSLGEDSLDWSELKAINSGVAAAP